MEQTTLGLWLLKAKSVPNVASVGHALNQQGTLLKRASLLDTGAHTKLN